MNGERVEGLSDDSPPVELPQIDLVEETYGQDGTMYVMGTSRRGGDVVVKLLPTSTTTKNWLRDFTRIQNGARISYNGRYGDATLGYATRLRSGYMKQARPGVSPGQNAEFTFVFEELIAEFDGADFGPSPNPDI